MSQQELDFQTHHGTTQSLSKPHPHQKVLNQCLKIEQQLIQQSMSKVITKLQDIWQTDFDCNTQQDIIFSIHLKESQLRQLNKFTGMIEPRLRKLAHQKLKLNKEDVHIQRLQEYDVRNIVLDIYVHNEMHLDVKVKIFICQKVTNLDEYNISYFQKGLKDKGFIVIIPTHSNFDNQQFNATNITRLQMKLFDPKQQFCNFIYQCLYKEQIKAYLPEQILSLITDMDYYPISFRQSCRRFRYCLQRSLTLRKQQCSWVDFYNLISLLEDIISRKFKHYKGYQVNIEKIIKVILSEDYSYMIPEKALNYELAARKTNLVDEETWLTTLQECFIKYLSRKQQYKIYTDFFKEQDLQSKPSKKMKKSRSQMLGIGEKNNIPLKNRLDNQINRVIKHVTQSIRQQANLVKWADIKYELRIKPPIPLLIHRTVSEDGETIQLVDQITSTVKAPLAHYLPMFEGNIGQAIYLLKRLQLQGLIDISKKSIRPQVSSNFFHKNSFSGKY